MCNKVANVKIITKHPVLPTEEEINENSRSHSAKLRVAEGI
jgi:16S rRNA (cytosine1402-N4)-methyltransferase